MIKLGDDWFLKDSRIYHACGPELVHHWTGAVVCACGNAVPQRVQSFHRWLGEQERRARASRLAPPRFPWQWQSPRD
jgi:hypothetical protein